MGDLEAAKTWIADRKAADGRGGKRDRGSSSGSTGTFLGLKEQLLRASIVKTEAEGRLKEYEAEIAQKNLVSLDEAKTYIAEILSPVRTLLDALPKACAVKANPSDPQLAEEAIREAVDGIYRAIDAGKDEGSANAE